MFSHDWEFKVRFAETDAAGIVYYPNFYKWMDQATHEMLHELELPTKKLLAEKRGVPLVEAQCQFRQPLYFDDWIKVRSAVSEVKHKVVKIEHRFYRDDRLVAEGYEVRAWISSGDGQLKAVAIPEDIRHKFQTPASGK